MKNRVNHNMLILARLIRGLSQSEIADRLGMSQPQVSKVEQRLITVSHEIAECYGKKLSFPVEFFYQHGEIFPSYISLFRKKQSLGKGETDQINALLNIQYLNLCKLLEQVEVDVDVPFMDLESYISPSDVARALRLYWKIPNGPINNLTTILERAGIFVLYLDVATNKFDGIRFVADQNLPIIAVNKNVPPDRFRFTLAHELGHLIMHRVVTPTADDEASLFASEFLTPSDQITFPKRIGLEHLADLKRYWKVSMASLAYKAKQNGAITQRQYQYLFTQLSQLGYRLREPVELDPPQEIPSLISRIMRIHLEQLNFSKQDLMSLFTLSENDFQQWWGPYLGIEKNKKGPLKLVKGTLLQN